MRLPKLGDHSASRNGLTTSDNFRFLRFWWEVGEGRVGMSCLSGEDAAASGLKWFPYMKGGEFRRWWGNQEFVVNWQGSGAEIKACPTSAPRSLELQFRPGITYPKIAAGAISARLPPGGFMFDVAGCSVFPPEGQIPTVLGLLNSTVVSGLLRYISPMINYESGHIAALPVPRRTSISRPPWSC